MKLLRSVIGIASVLALAVLFMSPATVVGEGILPLIPEAQSRYSAEQGCVEPLEEDAQESHELYSASTR